MFAFNVSGIFRLSNFFGILSANPSYRSKTSDCSSIIRLFFQPDVVQHYFQSVWPRLKPVTATTGDQTRFQEFYLVHFGQFFVALIARRWVGRQTMMAPT